MWGFDVHDILKYRQDGQDGHPVACGRESPVQM